MVITSRASRVRRRVQAVLDAQAARRTPSVFLSLPDVNHLKVYAEALVTAIQETYKRLKVISYLGLRQGDWRAQLINQIKLSNALIGFLEGPRLNVLFELGIALAMGKPIILVAPRGTDIPSMLSHLHVLWYPGKTPRAKTSKQVLEALDTTVFRALHRETVDERTNLQKSLLVGAPKGMSGLHRAPDHHRRNDEQVFDIVEHHYHRGELEPATDLLQARVAQGAQGERIFHILADTWFLRGEGAADPITAQHCYRQCLRTAMRGLRANGDSIALRKDEALALAKLGQLERAEKKFQMLRRDTESPDLAALVAYNLACINAQMRRKYLAMEHLEAAIQAKEYYRGLAWVDPDFDPLWSDGMFQALVFRL